VRLLIGDVRVHVSVAGEEWQDGVRRPTIVALHGGPGLDGTKLRWLMRPAAEYAQVVVPDQRGHGHSDLSAPAQWNLDVWADDLAALIDVLGLHRPVVLGTSFGGSSSSTISPVTPASLPARS
jgi:pimeloyl-ACP methyl ester carboxylesterase